MAGILDVFGGGKAFGMSWDAKKVYGSKPVIPELPTLESAQKTAVGANAASFADIAKLATGVNAFNQDQLNALIDRTLGPGVRQSIQDNLAAQARGEIPRDVQDAIYRGTAERSAGGNAFGGGGFSRNITARDLGLTSLDITNKALSSAESWLASAKAPTFDVTSMFITPMQQSAANTDQFNRNLLALPLGIEQAMHLEGGREASLSVHAAGIDLDLSGGYEIGLGEGEGRAAPWPLPNIIGVRK